MANKPLGFNMAAIHAAYVDRSAAERRCNRIVTGRMFKKDAQVNALLRIIECTDLTTLDGGDTPGRVDRLCGKARNPVQRDILIALKRGDLEVHTGAVCVYPNMVPEAVRALRGSGIPVASVATGFPAGQVPLSAKLEDIRFAVEAGAAEIDVVISRGLALCGKWHALYDEIVRFREACGDAHMKVILGTGNLGTLTDVACASIVAIQAGADFIKTSTGMEQTNATLPVSLVMVREIRNAMKQYPDLTVGFKPAGGIRTAKDAMQYLALVLEELGERATHPDRFRIGASGLVEDVNRQLEHNARGVYASGREQPAG